MPTGNGQLQDALDAVVAAGALGALAAFRSADGVESAASGARELGASELGASELGGGMLGGGPIDPAGFFRIGSVTKTFTMAAVLQLVGDGVLSLDDTVERWLPGLVPDGGKITVRNLLDHTSGLYNCTNAWFTPDGVLDLARILAERTQSPSPAQAIADATAHEPEFPPGSSIAYNNTGYLLAGMVIEAAGGRAFDEHVEARILRPLDLHDTVVRPGSDLPEPHAHGYLPTADGPVDVTTYDRTGAWAAGGFVSTATDLNRFFSGLLTGEILGDAQRREMLTPAPWTEPGVGNGLGLMRRALPDGGFVWGKGGSFFGYETWSYHAPDASRQLTLSLTMTTLGSPETDELLARFAFVFAP